MATMMWPLEYRRNSAHATLTGMNYRYSSVLVGFNGHEYEVGYSQYVRLRSTNKRKGI